MKTVLEFGISEFGRAFFDLVDDHSTWSQETFGLDSDRGPLGALKHLEKESRECQAEAEKASELGRRATPELSEELADCLLLLLDASRRAGITPYTLVKTAQSKMKKNRSRQWPKPVDGEPCEHVR